MNVSKVSAAPPQPSQEPERCASPVSAKSRLSEDPTPALISPNSQVAVAEQNTCIEDDCSVILSDGEEETSFQYRDSLLPGWARAGKPSAPEPAPAEENTQESAKRPPSAQGKWVSDSPVEPKVVDQGTLPSGPAGQVWAQTNPLLAGSKAGASEAPVIDDDIVCTSDIDSDESEDEAVQPAVQAPEDDKSLFRVSLKGDELPKINFNEEETAKERIQSVQVRRVDVVRSSMEQLAQESGITQETIGVPQSGVTKSANPLRQSLTSAHLRQMIAEVESQMPPVKEANTSKSQRPLTAPHATDPLSDVPVPALTSADEKVKALSASSLADEREALKQRKRLESLNRSFAESHNLKSSIADVSTHPSDEASQKALAPLQGYVGSTSSLQSPKSTGIGSEGVVDGVLADQSASNPHQPETCLGATHVTDGATVAASNIAEPRDPAVELSMSEIATCSDPMEVLSSTLDAALEAYSKSLSNPSQQALSGQFRRALMTMSARINDVLEVEHPTSRMSTKEASLVKAVDEANGNPSAVIGMLDKYSDMLVTLVQEKMKSNPTSRN